MLLYEVLTKNHNTLAMKGKFALELLTCNVIVLTNQIKY